MNRLQTADFLKTFLFTVLLGMGSCTHSSKKTSVSKYQGPFSWPPAEYSRVVGYAFKLPTNAWSLINRNQDGIDHKRLVRDSIRFDQLSSCQINDLLGAVLTPKISSPQAMCYEPRHMFVFYSDTLTPIAAIEACYSCQDIVTWPKLPERHAVDFDTLKQIRDQLGLKLTKSEKRLKSP
jgi:hypothetical protein